MLLEEADIRINYFHNATDHHLRMIGADRELLPSRSAWRQFYEADYARPIDQRLNYTLLWEINRRVVGFSSADNITFGEHAFMHLHIIDSSDRHTGMGTQFVRLSAAQHLRALQLQRLFCQPNAFNVAPNRTLQAAGFRYVFTKTMQPSPVNFLQPVTRWVLESADHQRPGGATGDRTSDAPEL